MTHAHSHDEHHEHHHDHHDHHHTQDQGILSKSLFLIATFMVVEYLGGYFFNSLALMADASHMANDALSLGVALLALRLASRFPKLERRLALLNGLSLVLIALYILYEAVGRWLSPEPILSVPMLMVAVLGLLVNVVVARMMLGANHDNLNVRGAYLHVLADLLGSVVAIVSGLGAWLWGWLWLDPVASALLSVIVLRSGWKLTMRAWRAV